MTAWVRDALNLLVEKMKDPAFVKAQLSYKENEASRHIHGLLEQNRRVLRRQKELAQLLSKAYENNVKGVIEDDVFMVLVNSFRKELSYLKSREHILAEKKEAAQKTRDGFAYFWKLIQEQDTIITLTRKIVGRYIDLQKVLIISSNIIR